MVATLKRAGKGKTLAQPVLVEKTATPEEKDNQLVTQLRELWKDFRKKDLFTRHKTGGLLNERWGDPDKPQEYGAGIIKKVCEAIGVDKSEVSRMRQFAKQFPTLDDLEKQYPMHTTWSAVKPLLVKNPTEKPAAPAPVAPEPEAPVEEETEAEPQDGDDAQPEGDRTQESSDGTEERDDLQSILACFEAVTEKLKELTKVSEAEREQLLQAAHAALTAAEHVAVKVAA